MAGKGGYWDQAEKQSTVEPSWSSRRSPGAQQALLATAMIAVALASLALAIVLATLIFGYGLPQPVPALIWLVLSLPALFILAGIDADEWQEPDLADGLIITAIGRLLAGGEEPYPLVVRLVLAVVLGPAVLVAFIVLAVASIASYF